jgi:hypothetical protein
MMELANKNNDNYFDPTPKLKSSPKPILFISFNNEKNTCSCGNKNSVTLLYEQKHCKNCLLTYLKNIAKNNDNNKYLDGYFYFDAATRPNIQEWCEGCFKISHFNNYHDHLNTTKQYEVIEKDCKLCGKFVYHQTSSKLRMCSDCYLISSGWVKSTFIDKRVPILYLPWWDASNKSRVCKHNLKFLTDCQKWCPDCFIVYVGCRYCLTTNIIFGITDQTQCKKCKRISNIDIDITNISSGNQNIDEFLISTRTNIDNHHQIADCMNYMDKNSDLLSIYSFIERELKNVGSKRTMEWIPYSQITNFKK